MTHDMPRAIRHFLAFPQNSRRAAVAFSALKMGARWCSLVSPTREGFFFMFTDFKSKVQ